MKTLEHVLPAAAVLAALAAPPALPRETVAGPLPGWTEVIFNARTLYEAGPDCVRARAHNSASALVREREVDLLARPLLRWAWRADSLPAVAPRDERSPQGDDFVARVYVIHKGFLPWNSQGISYVWARDAEVSEHWPNPHAGNAMMVVVQSGPEGLGRWHRFERDVRRDFREYLDLELDAVDAVAVMTDTDNRGGVAEVCYRLPLFAPAGKG